LDSLTEGLVVLVHLRKGLVVVVHGKQALEGCGFDQSKPTLEVL
jgi:hypothetical protein